MFVDQRQKIIQEVGNVNYLGNPSVWSNKDSTTILQAVVSSHIEQTLSSYTVCSARDGQCADDVFNSMSLNDGYDRPPLVETHCKTFDLCTSPISLPSKAVPWVTGLICAYTNLAHDLEESLLVVGFDIPSPHNSVLNSDDQFKVPTV